MKKFNVIILLIVALFAVGGITRVMLWNLGDKTVEKDQVYLVLKTISEDTDFWQIAVGGAEVAAIELGVEVVVKGPSRESYIEDQIELMEEIIAEKPEAIAIAASEYNALAEVCDLAESLGITVVTFDSDANMTKAHSFISTNNHSASQRIAHELTTLIHGKGKVAIISHVEGVSTSFERIEGFKQGLKPAVDIELIDQVYYTDNIKVNAYNAAVKLMSLYPEMNALYATNEITLLGAGQAVRDYGKEDEITVVGFDMSKDIALMIEQEVIDGTMVQRPFNMGYIAVKEALEVLEGKETEIIDTGAVLINKENMFLPENQKLIVPNVN